MATTPALTPELILSELGQSPARSIEPVTGGADTQIWRVALPDGEFALRVLRPNQQAAVVRERGAMDAARGPGYQHRACGQLARWRGNQCS